MSEAAERKRLMALRKRMSQKRPKFVKMESWRHKRLKDHWRQPKGVDNHMRLNLKGWPKSVNVGYRSPKAVRDVHPSGREEVHVYNVGDLSIIDPETQVARIGGSVGLRKRVRIVQEADLQGIRVLNAGLARQADEFGEAEEEEPSEEGLMEEEEVSDDEEDVEEADEG
ncbi:50S ribosomal protein L32e [Candidatus Bathyarchaeota archaeon]|nr:50S ribosomal protein L32e [Candidatus Bathyarchaeota archaeon]